MVGRAGELLTRQAVVGRVAEEEAAALHLPASYESETHLAGRVETLIELMGLEAFRDKLLGELSSGSRRIVELACILAQDPAVVLLDEPSAGVAQRETVALGPLLRILAFIVPVLTVFSLWFRAASNNGSSASTAASAGPSTSSWCWPGSSCSAWRRSGSARRRA